MVLVLKDRVRETTTVTGTGTATLLGAESGFDAFSEIGDGNTTYYCIQHQSADEWEVGIGTYTASGTTLARTTVLSSSNGGSAVNFSSGTKDVFVTIPAASVAFVPPGIMMDFMGTSVPAGYLGCDGSNVSRATYAALFAAIGTTWGVGDGSTTFGLPDARRRVTIGAGGTAVSGPANTVGSVGGAETHTLSVAEIPPHNHPGSTTDSKGNHSHTIAIQQAGDAYSGGGNPNPYVAGGSSGTNTTGAHAHNVSVASQGSGGAHNNMQPSIVVTKIIKT